MNHVSVSPTDGNGPTQAQRKTLTRVGIKPTTFGLEGPPLYRLSYKVRREQVVGTEDVKVTAMNMYKYKERLRLYKRILVHVHCRDFNIFSSHGLLPSDLVAQSVERWRSNPKVVGLIPTLVRVFLCPCVGGPISISRANAHMVHMG